MTEMIPGLGGLINFGEAGFSPDHRAGTSRESVAAAGGETEDEDPIHARIRKIMESPEIKEALNPGPPPDFSDALTLPEYKKHPEKLSEQELKDLRMRSIGEFLQNLGNLIRPPQWGPGPPAPKIGAAMDRAKARIEANKKLNLQNENQRQALVANIQNQLALGEYDRKQQLKSSTMRTILQAAIAEALEDGETEEAEGYLLDSIEAYITGIRKNRGSHLAPEEVVTEIKKGFGVEEVTAPMFAAGQAGNGKGAPASKERDKPDTGMTEEEKRNEQMLDRRMNNFGGLVKAITSSALDKGEPVPTPEQLQAEATKANIPWDANAILKAEMSIAQARAEHDEAAMEAASSGPSLGLRKWEEELNLDILNITRAKKTRGSLESEYKDDPEGLRQQLQLELLGRKFVNDDDPLIDYLSLPVEVLDEILQVKSQALNNIDPSDSVMERILKSFRLDFERRMGREPSRPEEIHFMDWIYGDKPTKSPQAT